MKWLTSDQPKIRLWTDHSRNDASAKTDMFPAEHTLFKATHHVPIYVDLYRLNQPTAHL